MGNFGPQLALLCALWGAAANAGCAVNTVEVRGSAGAQRFSVEIADTEDERAHGLMDRRQMASSAGMLFVYDQPKHVYFWMKDTLIPLDMVFADAEGRVTKVHGNAIPEDRTPIDGGENVMFVLEINGGLAKRMGISEGALLRAAPIEQSSAIWPCSGE
jgi:hypothetical protein